MFTLFTAPFENVTVAAIQDLFAIKCSANNGLLVRRVSLSAGGVVSPATLRVRLKRLPATITIGSGGNNATFQKTSSNMQVPSVSTNIRINDTTQATTTGTAQVLAVWQWNMLQDFLEVPPTMEERWECAINEGIVVDLVAAPAASTVMSGFIVFEEV